MMRNNKMKIVGVMIMMMILGQGDNGVLCVEVGSKIEPKKLSCEAKCSISCILSNLAYPVCLILCIADCPDHPPTDCISGCGVNKSITINIDARGVVNNVVDSCLQKCEEKN
ncbi:hypothetical protein PHAVU_011G081300 [Phaseolus vulgaris]|uniref:Acidic protein n=1 Tax=Phaseolus vulgaris TaxID=3885 RepID=V7AJK1_PHAVU|nr:hypothetical protein PHAVU_011G081300g [Phaseolus vulgaris]ESW04271.1 hypothetical protein PHAVU_011G081300g [Phaseolus vulgaris]